jgi:hypothetical protein
MILDCLIIPGIQGDISVYWLHESLIIEIHISAIIKHLSTLNTVIYPKLIFTYFDNGRIKSFKVNLNF